MKYLKLTLTGVALILFIFIACTKSSNGGFFKIAQKGGAGLLGTDADHNGIRDDIDQYLNKRTANSEKKRAALSNLARDYQSALAVIDQHDKALAIAAKMEKSRSCAHALFDDDASDEIAALQAEIYNTYDRSIAGIRLENIMHERPVYLPEDDDRIKDCPFDTSKFKN